MSDRNNLAIIAAITVLGCIASAGNIYLVSTGHPVDTTFVSVVTLAAGSLAAMWGTNKLNGGNKSGSGPKP